MRFRKLRIARSVGWGLACMFLIVLWVRSHEKIEAFERTSETEIATDIGSESGTLTFSRNDLKRFEGFLPPEAHGWKYEKYESDPDRFVSRFAFKWIGAELEIRIPYWCPLVLFAVSAALPWLYWHFTLRTLLIITTLVAVALGLIAWLP